MTRVIKTGILILLIFLAIFPRTTVINTESETIEQLIFKSAIIKSPLYTAPFNVTSDDDFISHGFPGNGTEESPYIIEYFDIKTSEDYGIFIEGTSKHFIIQNGYVDAYKNGIRIQNVASNTTTIQNCTSYKNSWDYYGKGIYIYNSDYSKVVNNTCWGNENGITISGSDNCLIEGNNCTNNFIYGFSISGYFCKIQNNILENNTYAGISTQSLYYSNIEGNIIRNNRYGIRSGSYYESSLFCNITYNLIVENQEYGIYLDYLEEALIHHNKFISNNIEGESQAYDNTYFKSNRWYDNVTNEGNYWNDFTSKGFSYKYEIAGGKEIDRYPLNENLELIDQIYTNMIMGVVLLVYLISLSTLVYYRMKKDAIQMRIQRYKNRKKTRKSEPIDRDYDKLVDEEYEKTKKKMLLRGR